MDNESHRPIEKLLREYAERRRGELGKPMELHQVDRRALQEEVSRKRPVSAKPWWASLVELMRGRPGWALTGAAVLVVALTASTLFVASKPGKQQVLALNRDATFRELSPTSSAMLVQSAKRDDEAVTVASLSAARLVEAQQSSPPVRAWEQASAPAEKQVSTYGFAASDTSVQPLPLEQRAQAPALLKDSATVQLQRRYGLAPAAPATPSTLGVVAGEPLAAPLTATLTPGQSAPTAGASDAVSPFTGGLKFEGQRYAKDQLAGATAVLASFSMQPLGRQLRVVDSDGSVYSGEWETMRGETDVAQRKTTFLRAADSRAAAAKMKSDAPVLAQTPLLFKVAGTNVTLGQPVLFTGSWLGGTNHLRFVTVTDSSNTLRVPSVAQTRGNTAAPDGFQLSTGEGRILGKVVVGRNNEVQIQAIPAER